MGNVCYDICSTWHYWDCYMVICSCPGGRTVQIRVGAVLFAMGQMELNMIAQNAVKSTYVPASPAPTSAAKTVAILTHATCR